MRSRSRQAQPCHLVLFQTRLLEVLVTDCYADRGLQRQSLATHNITARWMGGWPNIGLNIAMSGMKHQPENHSTNRASDTHLANLSIPGILVRAASVRHRRSFGPKPRWDIPGSCECPRLFSVDSPAFSNLRDGQKHVRRGRPFAECRQPRSFFSSAVAPVLNGYAAS